MSIIEENTKKRKTIKWVVILLIVIILALGYMKLFVIGWAVQYEDVQIDYSKEGNNIVCINFESNNNHILLYNDEENVKVMQQIFQSPWNKSLRKKLSYGVTFVNKNTILDIDGHAHTLVDEDIVLFEFNDKIIEVDWRNVALEVGIK